MSLLPPEVDSADDAATGCGAIQKYEGTPCLSREARVVAVQKDQVHFELLALPGCMACPGGMFCPSSKLRATQTLVLSGTAETPWIVGDRARLQIRTQSASPVAWILFGWPLLSVLVSAVLISQIVAGRYQDLAIVVAASLAAIIALRVARARLSVHSLIVGAVAVDDTARPSPEA